jgi:hypothetical protein
VPNLQTPENLAIAQKALDGFNAVLANNPQDLTGRVRQPRSMEMLLSHPRITMQTFLRFA